MIFRSNDGKHRLGLELLPIPERRHAGWHSYVLSMERGDTGRRFELRTTEDSPLFLCWEFYPEVEDFCSGIRAFVADGKEFTFEPMDERDFTFVARREGGAILVQVSVAHHAVAEDLGWPAGLEVDAAELIRFADGLEAESGPVRQVPQDKA